MTGSVAPRLLTGILLISAGILTRSPAQLSADDVLATFDGGQVTLADVQARWLLSSFPAEELMGQLASLSEVPSGERSAPLEALEGEIRETGLDLICLAMAEREGWSEDPALLHRARARVVRRYLPQLTERLITELPSPSPGEISDLLSEYHSLETRPERREALQILLLPDETQENCEEELQSRANEVLRRLENGEDFGQLAAEFSEGPGWSQGGRLGLISREEAPWAELGEAVFSAATDGSPSIFTGDLGVHITVIERIVSEVQPSPQDVWNSAESHWRRDRAAEETQRQIDEWLEEMSPTLQSHPSAPDVPLLTLGDEVFTLGDLQRIYPNRSVDDLQMLAQEFANIEAIARNLVEFFPADEVERQFRAAHAQEARREWGRRLVSDFEPSPESIRAMYDQMVEGGTFPHHTTRHMILCRVMPQPIGEAPTSDSLRRWRGLEAEAQRVREVLVEECRMLVLAASHVEDLNESSPFEIEYLDMGDLSAPPTFLGQAFFDMEPGDLSEVIYPREDVALIYGLVYRDSIRPPSFADAEHLARNGVIAMEMESRLSDAIPDLIGETDFRITFDFNGN